MNDIEQVLAAFPKSRQPLPLGQQAIYEEEYLANREGKGFAAYLAQKLETWMHRKVAASTDGDQLLEIGGGTLNHLPYLSKYKSVDIIEPSSFLYDRSPHKKKVRRFYRDIAECGGNRYDSIYSIAVLEHVTDLPAVLAHIGLMLRDGGTSVHAIPCEGGLLWGLGWRLSTGLAYRIRTGFSYKNLVRHEHVNTYDEIIALHRYFFRKMVLSYFPIYGKHGSFYCCIEAHSPIVKNCEGYLQAKPLTGTTHAATAILPESAQ